MKLLCACLLLAAIFYSSAADTVPDISQKAFDAAVALQQAGKFAEAEKDAQAMVASRTQALGANDKETLRARLLLTRILCGGLKYAAAEPLLRELLPLLTQALGAEGRDTLACHVNLIEALVAQGKHAEAEPECRRLISDMTRVLGPANAQTLAERAKLVGILAYQEKRTEAELECRSLTADMTRVLGPEHAQTLAERKVLTGILYNQKKYAEAEPQCRSLIADMTRVLGPENAQTLAEREMLPLILYHQKKRAEAEQECRSLIADMTRVVGPANDQTLAERATLIRILYNQKKYAEVEPEYRSMIADMTRMPGPEDAKTLAVRAALAGILFQQNKHAEAVQEQRAILTIQERVPGTEEKAILTTCQDLAVCLRALNQPQQALTYAQRALAGRLRLLGPDANDTDASQRLVNLLTYTAAATGPKQRASAASAQEPDPPIAMVDGALIRTSDLQAAIQEQEPEIQQIDEHSEGTKQALAELKRKTLDKLIDQQLLINEFHSTGATLKPHIVDDDIRRVIREDYRGDRAAFLAGLAKRGQTEAAFRAQRLRMLTLTVMRLSLAGDVQVTPQEVRDYYDKHKDHWAGDAEVKIHTLTIPKPPEQPEAATRRQAQGLRTRILEGADFAATARTHSQDSHAEDGGAWDWTLISDLAAPVRDAVQKTKPGQVSELIEQGGNFILLRLDDYRAPATPPFEKVRKDIAQMLEKEKFKQRVDAQTEQLRSEADIQRLAPAGM